MLGSYAGYDMTCMASACMHGGMVGAPKVFAFVSTYTRTVPGRIIRKYQVPLAQWVSSCVCLSSGDRLALLNNKAAASGWGG